MRFASFFDEMVKIAVRIPFLHGTNAEHALLQPGAVEKVLKSDPNPQAVYTAIKSRTKVPGIENFAHQAVRRHGGSPFVASGKMDTRKGWQPFNLVPRQTHLEDIEEARDLVRELDRKGTADFPAISRERRAEIWRILHESVGSWHNVDQAATLKPSRYRPVG